MTINIRDNDQTASTAEPQPETQAGPEHDLMPTPVAETDADDDEMHVDTDTDDDAMDAELDIDDDEMQAGIDTDDTLGADIDDDEMQAGIDTDDTLGVEVAPDDDVESGDEPHLELNTGAFGRAPLGADMYDAPAPGDDPAAELVPDAAVAAGEPETLDAADEVDLRVVPVGVATEAAAVVEDASVYDERWNAIQTSFVDEPRQAVESADRLVAEAMEHLAKTLVSQRDSLQAQWRQGDDVDTEQLRVVFQGYRAFLFGLLPT